MTGVLVMEDTEQRILDSWDSNAAAWTRAVRGQRIESRRLATDAAILAAVAATSPRRALDVGCGEGWLCRALHARGIATIGIDASLPLVESARAAGTADVRQIAYSQLLGGMASLGRFDAIACNFALLTDDVVPLLRALRDLLEPGGRLIIQTVHPWTAAGESPYEDGWRVESFDAFGGEFIASMPWYFRTLASWLRDIDAAGLKVVSLDEPQHPQTKRPLALLIAAGLSAQG